MKWVIRITAALVIITVLVFIAAGITLMTIDPNAYKDRIENAVENATGRKLEIAGDIETTFFPVLGFSASNITMGNPSGFVEQEFLTVGKAQAGVEILPLFSRRVNITRVILDQPDINIVKRVDGRTNLSLPMKDKQEEGEAATEEGRSFALSIGQIEINGGQVSYKDKVTGQTIYINPLDLTMPGFDPGRETPFDLAMVMTDGTNTIKTNASALLKATPREGIFDVADLRVRVVVDAAAIPEDISASVTGGGHINMQDKTVTAELGNIDLAWQGTDINGQGKISGSFSQPQIDFSATAPMVNFDILRAKHEQDDKAKQQGQNKNLVPLALLRKADFTGKVEIDRLITSGLSLGNVKAQINNKDGLLTIDPVSMDMYDGTVNAALSFDARGSVPDQTLKADLNNIKIGGLLQDKLGQDYVTGTAKIRLDLASRGNTVDALRSNSSGVARFAFGEGYINKWQLSKLLNQAIAFFETGALPQDGVAERVYFTSLNATFNGQAGAFLNDDLALVGPKVHALGSGVVNLARETVDYTVRVGLGTQAEKGATRIPVRISGPLAHPSYQLDIQAMAEEKIKSKVEEKGQDLINKAFEKLGGEKDVEPSSGEEESAGETTRKPDAGADAAKQLLQGILGGGKQQEQAQ